MGLICHGLNVFATANYTYNICYDLNKSIYAPSIVTAKYTYDICYHLNKSINAKCLSHRMYITRPFLMLSFDLITLLMVQLRGYL